MVKHIVMWKLRDFAEGAGKEENAAKIKASLEALRDVIAEIKSIEVGINFDKSIAAYDVVLVSEFENAEALDRYQNHPEHVKAADFISKVRESRILVDYEA